VGQDKQDIRILAGGRDWVGLGLFEFEAAAEQDSNKSGGNAFFCWIDAFMVKHFPGGGGRGKSENTVS
jgi:hypothetical protein